MGSVTGSHQSRRWVPARLIRGLSQCDFRMRNGLHGLVGAMVSDGTSSTRLSRVSGSGLTMPTRHWTSFLKYQESICLGGAEGGWDETVWNRCGRRKRDRSGHAAGGQTAPLSTGDPAPLSPNGRPPRFSEASGISDCSAQSSCGQSVVEPNVSRLAQIPSTVLPSVARFLFRARQERGNGSGQSRGTLAAGTGAGAQPREPHASASPSGALDCRFQFWCSKALSSRTSLCMTATMTTLNGLPAAHRHSCGVPDCGHLTPAAKPVR